MDNKPMCERPNTNYGDFGVWVPTHRFVPATCVPVEVMSSGGDFFLARYFNGEWQREMSTDQWRKTTSNIVSWKPRSEDDWRPKREEGGE